MMARLASWYDEHLFTQGSVYSFEGDFARALAAQPSLVTFVKITSGKPRWYFRKRHLVLRGTGPFSRDVARRGPYLACCITSE